MPRPFAPRTVLLRSGDGREFLRLAATGIDAAIPSLEVRAEGTARGFSGGAEASIDGFTLKEFAAALRGLEKSRQGAVELRSMMPDELRLVIRSIDHAGHLLVEFTISRIVLAGDRPENVTLRVAGAFELDPGTLGEVLGGFTQLAKAVAA